MWLPRGVGPDAARLVWARGLRGFADGLLSILLASHLTALGFSALEAGVLVSAALLGSAALTLAVGLRADRVAPRTVLLGATALMAATGLGFAGLESFAALVVVAFVGTLNPSGGDVSVFLPSEQAVLADSAPGSARTALFARYNLAGILLAAAGALASGLPAAAAERLGGSTEAALRSAFLLYVAVAVALVGFYAGLRARHPSATGSRGPLARSRRTVLRLTALFSLDSFGGGFVVDTLLALWLLRRFGLSLEATGVVFFAARVLAAFSQLASAWLAARIGLVRTMVYTHLPANAFLILAALAPDAGTAIACLLARMALAQMDVPARQALVMALVPPEERAGAASLTNAPRSLAAALAPLLAGALLDRSSFGWPLVLAGAIKIAYDLLLLVGYRTVRTEDAGAGVPPA
jgi:MFS family permease